LPVTVAVKATGVVLPCWTEAVGGLIDTSTPAAEATVTVAVPKEDGLACEVAVTRTRLSGLGGVAGGVYAPAVVMAPHVAPEQFAPESVQVTL